MRRRRSPSNCPPSGGSLASPNDPPARPAAALVAQLRGELMRRPPFDRMAPSDVDAFLAHAELRYYAPDEVVVQPGSGPVREVYYIRRGAVSGVHGLAELSGGAFQYEAGDLFPLSAAQAGRPVTATYRASGDAFLLAVPAACVVELARSSPVLADFLRSRTLHFLDLSRKALQAAHASQALAEHSFETPLADLGLREPVTCGPATPLREVLQAMHGRRIGSMMVVDAAGALAGIFTRNDVLGRVALAGVSLDQPVSAVMVSPVHALDASATAGDAAVLMSRHAIRHVPVTRGGRVVGIVTERDLFALQKLSLKQIGAAIRAAPDVAGLQLAAQDVRRFARHLLGQGVHARQLTALVSHLNDVVAQRTLQVVGARMGIDPGRWCWLALGSEGRSEQTIATDQDNALVLPDALGEAGRAQALAFGRAVNEALDACGYPLCRGGIMAGEAACCLTLGKWRERFAGWIEHGSPADLLNASIFFDFRALAGDTALVDALRAEVLPAARGTPRFLKQMALNALARGAPLNWLGGVDADARGTVDLKLQGTALFVDAARIYALATGVEATGTRARLEAAGRQMGVPASEYEAWAAAFEFLQMLRLRVQLDGEAAHGDANRIAVDSLNDIDRRMLRESFRCARLLQQRLRLDYDR
jgi:CBS domain-containing protein